MPDIDWDALAQVIDVFSSEEYTPVLHGFQAWMIDQLDERALEPAHFVDVGCGTALFAAQWVEWYPEASFTLIDDSRAMLGRARERLGGDERVRFLEAEALAGFESLEPGSVDALVLCRSLYALPDPAKVASRAVELLSPRGMIFLFDFTRAFDIAQMDDFYRDLEPERWPICRALTVDFLDGIAEGRYRVYDERALVSLWGAAGAELVAYQSHEPDFPQHQACFARSQGG